jgi:hypothetical protein
LTFATGQAQNSYGHLLRNCCSVVPTFLCLSGLPPPSLSNTETYGVSELLALFKNILKVILSIRQTISTLTNKNYADKLS